MKKRLEADLISIAHRILQLKNKSDVNQLFLETQKLYEKLAVLRFVEEQYGEARPTIGQAAIVDDIETFYDNKDNLTPEVAAVLEENVIEESVQEEVTIEESMIEDETETVEEVQVIAEEPVAEIVAPVEPVEETQEIKVPIAEIEATEAITAEVVATEEVIAEVVVPEEDVEIVAEAPVIEETIEEVKPEVVTPPAFKPAFELYTEKDEPKVEFAIETAKKAEAVQISFEDLLGHDYNEPQFVKVDDVPATPKQPIFEAVEKTSIDDKASTTVERTIEKTVPKVVSINDKFSKGIEIDLNDQIAFVKHLFSNSREDYNRVLSQLNTFDNFYETKAFIDEMVKPDYNEWKGKEDYEERFMDIIEKKFL